MSDLVLVFSVHPGSSHGDVCVTDKPGAGFVCLSDAVLFLLSAGYYMGMCVAAPEKNLGYIYQVGWLTDCSLHRATPSVVYLRKHINVDVDAFGE